MKRTKSVPGRVLLLCVALVMLIGTAGAEGLLPSLNRTFGTAMPSIGLALSRTADETGVNEDGRYEVYNAFTYEDYTAFGAYLAGTGAALKDTAQNGSTVTVTLSVRGATMEFVYDWKAQTATAVYPSGTRPETEAETVEEKASILPEIETIGKELPSMSRALSREPDAAETLNDGSRRETYNNFGEADYTTFSRYLLTAGCTVDDYHVEDDSVMVIRLSSPTGSFTFTYDSLRHTGTVVYPQGSRVEAGWAAPTATPTPDATAAPILKTTEMPKQKRTATPKPKKTATPRPTPGNSDPEPVWEDPTATPASGHRPTARPTAQPTSNPDPEPGWDPAFSW